MTAGTRRERQSSEFRRHRVRLKISREASRLFLQQGVAATGGDQIARVVGVSTRTVWRHFHSKESLIEPIIRQGISREMAALRRWQPQCSLEDHLTGEFAEYIRSAPASERADHELAVRVIVLTETEPALRTAWLTACHQAEGELAEIISARLDLPADSAEIQLLTAAASGAIRVVNEEMAGAALRGAPAGQALQMHAMLSRAVRNATGGTIGDPVTAPTRKGEPRSL
ncbi:TetR/AcrR family transcriptional regulator [Streptomyces scopuliridis]|uniref:TetR/AcrR family transcriptional regulator n=1 Tax=Streptomyces scopuliridis TaxID=452529 RepID=UPI00368D0224